MKKKILSLATMLLFAMLPTLVSAQATESTVAAANLITPLTITETSALHFGTMAISTNGTCILSTDGTRTATGGVNLSSAVPASANATYTVGGLASTAYAVTLPATITVSHSSGTGADLTISALKALVTNTGTDQNQGNIVGALDGSGADGISVGGTLSIPDGTNAGLYNGTFDVTIAYN